MPSPSSPDQTDRPHPRPDFQREPWIDLCGRWQFQFDPDARGWDEGWFLPGQKAFSREIQVPYSWAAPLSGIGEEFEGYGWYARELSAADGSRLTAHGSDKGGADREPFTVSREPPLPRPFLVFGAVDWSCDVWLNGIWMGSHEGGYTPFEFDLSPHWRWDQPNALVVRAHDVNAKDTLRGKQGYGSVAGIWQPVWLERRGETWLERVQFTPDVVGGCVVVDAVVSAASRDAAGRERPARPTERALKDPSDPQLVATAQPASAGFPADRPVVYGGSSSEHRPVVEGGPPLALELLFDDPAVPAASFPVTLLGDEARVRGPVAIPNPRLWSPDDPHLYDVRVRLLDRSGAVLDEVRTYFGMRSIERGKLPGRDYECILLNGEPVYISGALDQCYHPEGYYTYPTDEDARRDVELAKAMGFNTLRFHIKAEEPRKLYWADRLGVLVMADIPNCWGEPTPAACARWEREMRAILARDHNHPSIWTWIAFNETWGLNRTHYAFTPELMQSASVERPTDEWRRRVEGELAGQYLAQERRAPAPGFTAAEELLFRHEVRGNFRYRLRGLDDARAYRLVIGNVELSHPLPGYRVFELKVNGERAREPIDYAAEFELRRPALIELEVRSQNGLMEISFEPVANHARLSFLRLYDQASGELVYADYAFERIESGQLAPAYLLDTQAWVRRVWQEMKRLDPSRLIEDNSAVLQDHVVTDLNTWHFYLHRPAILRAHMERVIADTYPGSTWNFVGDGRQDGAPLLNSECGNYWDIEYGAGDSDLSYHFKYMLNEFRRHPKLCGFVFTELYDVINEWNGFLRYDRTRKQFGYDAWSPKMTTASLMGPDLVVLDAPACVTVAPGETVAAPLLASFLPGGAPEPLTLRWRLLFQDALAGERVLAEGTQPVERRWWEVVPVETVRCRLPDEPGLATLAAWFEDAAGQMRGQNYIQWVVLGPDAVPAAGRRGDDGAWVVPFVPASFTRSEWPLTRQVNEGEKVSGFGAGFFEYEIPLPAVEGSGRWELLLEAGAKRTLPRDRDQLAVRPESDLTIFSAVAKWESGSNPNDYPQTDETAHPSLLEIHAGDRLIHRQPLPDDPADARGILSWHFQRSTTRLEDAGSYGYLVSCVLPPDLMAAAVREGWLRLRLSVPREAATGDAGGLALYGPRFGRHPFGPMLLFHPEEE